MRGMEANKEKDIRVSSLGVGGLRIWGPLFYQSSDTSYAVVKAIGNCHAIGVGVQMELYCNKLRVPGGHSSQDSTGLG